MRSGSRFANVLVLLACALLPCGARALGPPSKEAKLAYEEVSRLYRAKQWERCVERAERSFDAFPDRAWLFIAADCAEKAGDVLRALGLFERFVSFSREQGLDTSGQGVARRIRAAEVRLARTHCRVAVVTSPRDTTVTMAGGDGRPAALRRWLEPGTYVLRFERDGYGSEIRTVTATAGATIALEVSLGRVIGYGRLRVVTRPPGAMVLLDGKMAGQTPLSLGGVEAGRHTVAVAAGRHEEVRQDVEVVEGRATELDLALRRIPGRTAAEWSRKAAAGPEPTLGGASAESVATKWWFWTVIGAVVAGGVTAAVLLSGGEEEVAAPPATFLWDGSGAGAR